MTVRVFAPAKINLTLKVGAAGPDGYHPLESLVVFADVGDWVEAAPAEELTLAVGGPFATALESDAENLVVRAARTLAGACGIEPKAKLSLEKHLPVASGMGGGSADAAAALKALDAVWGLRLPRSRLMEIGAQIGADVPVCVAGHSAWMAGVGECVSPWRTCPIASVLVNPLKPLSTAAVFREFDRRALASPLRRTAPASAHTPADAMALARESGNDLAASARALMNDIGAIEAALNEDRRVRYACVSGSGASVFALLDTAEEARALAAEITQKHPMWWVRAAILAPA